MRHHRVVLAVLLFLSGVGAAAQELSGRVRETYQSAEGGAGNTESVLQNYEINFRNNVAQDLFWQARLRALLTGFDAAGVAATDTALLEPFLQVVYEGPAWQLSGGGRLTRLTPRGESTGAGERERRDLFGRMAWSAEHRPHLDWSLYRIDQREDEIDTSSEDRSLLTVSYGNGHGGTSLGLENRRFTDHRTAFTRDSIQATWNGDWRGSFGGGRVVLGGQALVVEGRTEEETPQAILVDVRRRPRSGLYAVDTTPLSGTLTDVPALIDGDLTSPASDLSGDFRNIGVDLGFPEQVEAVFLYLERRLLPGNDTDYAWDVYGSPDGEFWTLLTAAAQARFDDLENRFEIRFAATSTRFLKVVNTRFSRDEPPLAVTEIEAIGRETRSGRERRTEGRRSGNLTLAWRAHRIVDVSLNTFSSRQFNETGGIPRADEDLNSTLSTTVRPGSLVATVRLQAINRSTSLGRPEQDRIASVGLAASPLPTVDLSVTGTRRANRSLGDLLVATDSLNLRAAARFLHDIEAALDLGFLRQNEEILDRATTRRSANLSLVATLRPGLFMSNNWSVERIGFGGGTSFPDRTDLDLRSRLAYRPTRVLGVAVEYFYQDIAGLKGVASLYDLDWLPFPGGALQLQVAVARDRRSVTGSLRDETRLAARWTLNPRTLLDVAHAIIRSGDVSAERQDLTSVFLEYRF
jgi:hypothetical protein